MVEKIVIPVMIIYAVNAYLFGSKSIREIYEEIEMYYCDRSGSCIWKWVKKFSDKEV